MSRTCTVCRHAERGLIDKQLVEGVPLRSIAKQFGTSATALLRHGESHLPGTLPKAKEAEEVAHGSRALTRMKDLDESAMRILKKAEKTEDLKTALKAVGESRRNQELLAKLSGDFDRPQTPTTAINIGVIDARLKGEPMQILRWIAANRRLPSTEERQELLIEASTGGTDEPLKKR